MSPLRLCLVSPFALFPPAHGGARRVAELVRRATSLEARAIVMGRRASRLKADFDLSLSALSLVMTYLQRIEEMEAELARLRVQLLR